MQRIVCWCAAAVAVVAAEKDFFADAMSVDRPPLPPENDIVHLDNETDGGARARHLWITPIAYDTEAYCAYYLLVACEVYAARSSG